MTHLFEVRARHTFNRCNMGAFQDRWGAGGVGVKTEPNRSSKVTQDQRTPDFGFLRGGLSLLGKHPLHSYPSG